MTIRKYMWAGLLMPLIQGTAAAPTPAANTDKAQVHMVVTVEALKDGESVSVMKTEGVQVRQGKNNLPVVAWIPSRGEQAGLQLFILIDETSNTNLGSQLGDIRDFITAQPATTWIGLGYMRNTTVTVLQNFTNDHEQVAKALRLPLGGTGASDSPYLSLIGLMKGWPESKLRREVLMVTDGVDRLRSERSSPQFGGGRVGRANMTMTNMPMTTMPYISVDVDRASEDAQRYGVIVHSIYTPGVGHVSRNYYEVTNGQNGIAKLADETGGESFFLGTQTPVSFKPYLERLQSILDNQYYLVFQAVPGKKAELRRVKLKTEAPNVEIVSADNVWVPAAKK